MLPYEPQGDADFWSLWEENKKIFYRKCLKILNGDICQAEDALSISMLKAREKMIHYRDKIRNFRGWALRLTENVCLDLLRKHRKLVSYDHFPESLLMTENEDHIPVPEYAERYRSREAVLKGVFDMINGLPPRLRQPALLRFLFSKPYRDIAGRLRISEENARKRIQEARALLKHHYGKEIPCCFFTAAEKMAETDSPLMKRIRRDAGPVLATGDAELELYCSTAWIVFARPTAGPGREVPVFLPLKPRWRGKGFASIIRYISKHPGGWKRRLELAQMLYVMGVWDLAEQEFRYVLNKHPRSFSAWMLLGNMLMESGRSGDAERLFRTAASLVYLDASRRYLAGMSAMCRERHAEALTAFGEACKLSPSNVTFVHARGICLFRTGRYEEAMGVFGEILAGRPDDIVSLAYCCEMSALLNRAEEAGVYAERMLRVNPDDLFALRRKLELDRGKGDLRGREWKRFVRLSERFEQIGRILKEAKNEIFTIPGLQTSLRRMAERKGGEVADYGDGGTPLIKTVRTPALLVYKRLNP